jgi:hypothetical protein
MLSDMAERIAQGAPSAAARQTQRKIPKVDNQECHFKSQGIGPHMNLPPQFQEADKLNVKVILDGFQPTKPQFTRPSQYLTPNKHLNEPHPPQPAPNT